MKTPVYIAGIASVSPLGNSSEEVWKNYKDPKHLISKKLFGEQETFAAYLPEHVEEEIDLLRNSNPVFKNLDLSVLYAIYTSRKVIAEANWKKGDEIGINIGSSRGATGLFEKYHQNFLETGKAETLASPTTTLGNISSWVAQDIETTGPEISHSVTCSTGLQAVLNGVAWLNGGMAEKFLVGGSEAALTPFTIAQMKAMKIYATEDLDYPCRALDIEKQRNTMILGEGAGVIALQLNSDNCFAKISGVGYATERLNHPASISSNGECFQKAMKMAIGEMDLSEIDVVVMHAPGTVKGDQAEINAISALFGNNLPAMTSNKWKIGHTFGASGVLSLELAVLMLQHQEFIPVPFSSISKAPARLKNILVNAVGFGGNAVSILINNS